MIAEDLLMPGRKTFVLRVRGESMIDEGICDGDLIICYEAAEANNGQLSVALVDDDQATVKTFYRDRDTIRLEPANKEHRPLILRADQVRIQGIVVGLQRRQGKW